MNIRRAILQAILLWCGILIQSSFVSSLGSPWAAFPLLLVWGIILLHERSLMWGVWWLILSGLLLEWRGLGFGLTVAYAGTAIVIALLITSVFAKRSLAGLFGVTVLGTVTFCLLRFGGMMIWNVAHHEPLFLGLSIGEFVFVTISVPTVVFLLTSLRRRIGRFARERFVRQDSPYDFAPPF